ncbi:MAG TPA: alpha/beta hydrolase [Streptosporangiaceae bacterium]
MDVSANGVRLHADITGQGPTLIFLHGMCGGGWVWNDQVSRLSADFRCVTYDRRGHSRSGDGPEPHTVELHADDAAALIKELDLAPCVLVGSSGGARVGLDVVRRHGSLLRGAVLSEPPAGALAPETWAAMVAEMGSQVGQAAESGGPRAAVDAFFDFLCPGLWSAIDEPAKDRYRDNSAMLFADLGMPAYQVTPADLAANNLPVQLVAGTQSHPALRAPIQVLASAFPNAALLELPCGHVTYAEQPAAFAEAVASFAAGLG